jgi:hypothetical protein
MWFFCISPFKISSRHMSSHLRGIRNVLNDTFTSTWETPSSDERSRTINASGHTTSNHEGRSRGHHQRSRASDNTDSTADPAYHGSHRLQTATDKSDTDVHLNVFAQQHSRRDVANELCCYLLSLFRILLQNGCSHCRRLSR